MNMGIYGCFHLPIVSLVVTVKEGMEKKMEAAVIWVVYTGYMVVFLTRGPQYRPQYTIILIMGTPKMVPLILGKPPYGRDAYSLHITRQILSLWLGL